MNDKLDLGIVIGRIFLVIAAMCVTSFPLLYLFSPWHKSLLGRVMMLQSATLALAINLKVVLTFFTGIANRTFLVWANTAVLIAIVIASTTLTYLLWTFNYRSEKENDNDQLD